MEGILIFTVLGVMAFFGFLEDKKLEKLALKEKEKIKEKLQNLTEQEIQNAKNLKLSLDAQQKKESAIWVEIRHRENEAKRLKAMKETLKKLISNAQTNKRRQIYPSISNISNKADATLEQIINKENDPLKIMGDNFERLIGLNFEIKNEVVIYNGFIRGIMDEGVDIISISLENKIVNLIN